MTTWADKLERALKGAGDAQRIAEWVRRATRQLAENTHGDWPRWQAALDSLPVAGARADLNQGMPALGAPVEDREALVETLRALHPWRKGPLELGGVAIDTEWRSDWKWDRIEPHVKLSGQRILDVGSGNGYFGLRMLGAGARCVVGIDPTWLFVAQWLVLRHFAPGLDHFVLPYRDTDLPSDGLHFDCVFSMGVLYHRRDPEDHLARLAACLAPDGQLVLETLVLDMAGDELLVPEGRYARMRNVWAVPSVGRLARKLREWGWRNIQVVDVTATRVEEQRSTPWMRFESLEQCLDPDDPEQTIEGYPAPVRALVLARKPH